MLNVAIVQYGDKDESMRRVLDTHSTQALSMPGMHSSKHGSQSILDATSGVELHAVMPRSCNCCFDFGEIFPQGRLLCSTFSAVR